jgi:xanthine dehydrogenase YagR molybdenum-binding subunit
MSLMLHEIGRPIDRIDGRLKVTGAATYAYEYPVENPTYVYPIQSTIAKGRVVAVDSRAALAVPGVIAVISHENAPRLLSSDNAELAVFQSEAVAYRGQIVAAVVADSLERARYGASVVKIRYQEEAHDVELFADRQSLETPPILNAGFESDTASGDVDAALASAAVTLDQTYTTPAEHNNPLEPHATVASWTDAGLTLFDTTQSAHWRQADVATVFGLPPERVRVISRYVGGGFGSKSYTWSPAILTALAAKVVGRPVKLALTREQMFALVGYRTPTIQRIQMGADRDGQLMAVAHDVVEQSSTLLDFAEQTVVPTRMMYAAPNRRTTTRLARLDLPTTAWLRAPGECPGMYALESAMDELAVACGLDPIELRIRNEPTVDPETGRPFSSHGLVACFREGAARFAWGQRDPRPRARRDGRWLVGTGVAASTYPRYWQPSTALVRVDRDGRFQVRIDGTDIGTGAWTVLTQIAADALGAPLDQIELAIGDSALPPGSVAGGSMGTSSWGMAIVEAARALQTRLRDEFGGVIPAAGLEARGSVGENPDAKRFSMHAFGAQFAEVRVNVDTGEVRVPRLLGVFAAGRIVNPKLARSQFLGAMTMGLSMALFEESVLDPRFGDYVNHDFAEYHIATNADVGSVEVAWIDEEDPHLGPLGTKGIGEIGIVGTAAAIANAVYHATGIRVRDLPITLDKLLA